EMNGIAEDARLQFGRVLKNVQEKLSSYHNGIFVKWYESGGLDKNDVYYSINLYEISTNLENSKRDNFLNAPKTLQKEVMKKNAPEELKQQVYDGDITTNKEYQEMKRKLKETEQAKQQAERQAETERKERERLERENEKLASQEPIIQEKEVIPDHVKKEMLNREEKLIETTNKLDDLQSKLDMLSRQNSYMDDEERKEKEI